jgi:hypothetical protein
MFTLTSGHYDQLTDHDLMRYNFSAIFTLHSFMLERDVQLLGGQNAMDLLFTKSGSIAISAAHEYASLKEANQILGPVHVSTKPAEWVEPQKSILRLL